MYEFYGNWVREEPKGYIKVCEMNKVLKKMISKGTITVNDSIMDRQDNTHVQNATLT